MKLGHFFLKEGMISGIDYHRLFFVILVLRMCGHETFLTDCPFCKPSSRVIPAYPWLFCNSGPCSSATRVTQGNQLSSNGQICI